MISLMWDLRNKTNEQTNKNRLTDTDNRLVVAIREKGAGTGKTGEGKRTSVNA